MKKQFSIALLLGSMFSFSQIGLGTTTPNLSAQLDVTSTAKGFLMPRMTNSQKAAIPLPVAPGLQIWCTDCVTPQGQLQVYNKGTWISYPSATGVLPICGAKTTAGTFLVFMCHNLGVDTSLNPPDPFTYQNPAINGDYYQWGRRKDGHQLVNSTTIETQATNNTATLPTTVIGKFVIFRSDWRSVPTNTLWGDGTAGDNPAKAVNDPCPPGFKVPSLVQWNSIVATYPTNWTWTGNGYMVGSYLYLPASSNRNINGTFVNGYYGEYWSSTADGTDAWEFYFENGIAYTYSTFRTNGASVRCVSE
jgi:uncharacterized protein (TIGR02145 family)